MVEATFEVVDVSGDEQGGSVRLVAVAPRPVVRPRVDAGTLMLDFAGPVPAQFVVGAEFVLVLARPAALGS